MYSLKQFGVLDSRKLGDTVRFNFTDDEFKSIHEVDFLSSFFQSVMLSEVTKDVLVFVITKDDDYATIRVPSSNSQITECRFIQDVLTDNQYLSTLCPFTGDIYYIVKSDYKPSNNVSNYYHKNRIVPLTMFNVKKADIEWCDAGILQYLLED